MVRARLGYSAKASAETFGGIKRVTPQFVRSRAPTAPTTWQNASKVGGTIRADAAQGKKCKKCCGSATLK